MLNVFDHCRWLFREIINKTKTKINKEIFKVLSILWINLKYGNELKEETPFISLEITGDNELDESTTQILPAEEELLAA